MNNSGYDNTNSGVLFVNERKSTDRHPDFTGQVNVEGVEYWMSAWKRKSKNGRGFLSIALTVKDEFKGKVLRDEFDLGGSESLSHKRDNDVPEEFRSIRDDPEFDEFGGVKESNPQTDDIGDLSY